MIGEMVVSGILNIGASVLKLIINKSIAREGIGYEILKDGICETVGVGSDIAGTKIKEFFFKPKSIRENLEIILEEEFNKLDSEVYDGKFGGYIDYLDETAVSVDSLKESIIEWNNNHNLSIVSHPSISDIESFSDLFCANVKERIEADEILHQYLMILKTAETVNSLLEQIYEVKNTVIDLTTKEDLQNLFEEIKVLFSNNSSTSEKFYQIEIDDEIKGNNSEMGDIEITKDSSASIKRKIDGSGNKIGKVTVK